MTRLLYILSALVFLSMWAMTAVVYVNREQWLPEQFTIKLYDKNRPDIVVQRDDCFSHFFVAPIGVTIFVLMLIGWVCLTRNPKTQTFIRANPASVPGALLLMIAPFCGVQAFHLWRMLV
jgi:hypothetical protein